MQNLPVFLRSYYYCLTLSLFIIIILHISFLFLIIYMFFVVLFIIYLDDHKVLENVKDKYDDDDEKINF